MRTHGHMTIDEPTDGWSPTLPMDRGRRFVLAVTLLTGLFMTAAGVAALLTPGWFADAAGFPRHPHFVHDAGAFQLGIGVTLLLAVAWRNGLALALAGFLVADTTHAVNHAVDLGGHSSEKAGKTQRLRDNPRVEVSPSTARGRPTGPAIGATPRRLDDVESRRAARLLVRKYPVLHGVLVPLTHRLGRAKTGRTVHFQLTPSTIARRGDRPPTDTLTNPLKTHSREARMHTGKRALGSESPFMAAIR